MDNATALVVVDMQNDFCPGGALAVPQGDAIVPRINRAIDLFARKRQLITATRDWHPEQTGHFRGLGGIWPPHCIHDTPGAAFHAELLLPTDAVIVSKGTDPTRDDYSAFHAADERGTPLAELLAEAGVTRIYVCGLATDYCVKESVLEARRLGFSVTLLIDAVRGVDLSPGDSANAIDEMKTAGAEFATVADLDQ